MRGPKPKYRVELVESEKAELRQLVDAHNTPQGKVMRAWIVLDVDEHPSWGNQQIAVHAGCTDRAGRKW